MKFLFYSIFILVSKNSLGDTLAEPIEPKDHSTIPVTTIARHEGEALVLDKNFIYEFDIKSEHRLKKMGPSDQKKRNRFYVRYEEKNKSWVYDLTDDNGEFSTPRQFLMRGSIVRGNWLGETNDENKYYFHGEGAVDKRWNKTTGKVEYYMCLLSSPARKITYADPRLEVFN